jgi:hypothetical protein
MAAAVLTIDINARLAGLEQGLRQVRKDVQNTGKDIHDAFSHAGDSLIHFGRTLAGVVGIPLGAHELISFIGELKTKTIDAERTLNQLNAVLANTGNSAGLTAGDLEELAKELRASSVFDDEDIKKAETALLRFRQIQGDTFREALKLAPDLASVLGVGLPEAATLFGRALQEEGTAGMRAFRAAGVKLSESQLDLADRLTETGNKAGAMKIKLDEAKKSIGGFAEADNAGLPGASKRLTRAIDELEKAGGKRLFQGAAESANYFTGFLEALLSRIKDVNVPLSELLINLDKKGVELPRRAVRGAITDPGAEQAERDRVRIAQIQQQFSQIDEQRDLDEGERVRRFAANAATYYGEYLNIAKNAIGKETEAYRFAYDQRSISTTEFFAKQRELEVQSQEASRDFLGRQAAAQQAALSDPKLNRAGKREVLDKISSLGAQSDQALAESKQRLIALDHQQIEINRKLRDEFNDVGVALLAATPGQEVTAALAQFDSAHRDLVRTLDAEIRAQSALAGVASAAKADVGALRERVALQAALTQGDGKLRHRVRHAGDCNRAYRHRATVRPRYRNRSA